MSTALWTWQAAAQAPSSAGFPEESAPANTPAAPAPAPAPPVAPVPAASPTPAAAPAPAPVATVGEPPLPPEPGTTKKSQRNVSLTLSPLHLISPILELEVEVSPTPHLGLAAIGGFGSIKAESNDPQLDNTRFSAYELGLQIIGYPLQDFSSLQLGGELLWLKVSSEKIGTTDVRANAGGVAIGPFIGYKLVTEVGFTLFVQGGFEYLAAKAEATNSLGESADEQQNTFLPLLNFNLGWSF
ncbi:MAG TPA: hypothetical protein VG937_25790 [Polyangiaceae bacterium]|nr:hypothetical protein [Polyangiaceae bacterium]